MRNFFRAIADWVTRTPREWKEISREFVGKGYDPDECLYNESPWFDRWSVTEVDMYSGYERTFILDICTPEPKE